MKVNEQLRKKYVTDKLVQFFPGDTDAKFGYIRDVDEFGFIYEITKARRNCDLGVYFRNHASNFTFKELNDAEKKAIL